MCPGIILSGHGSFTWGEDQSSALIVAEVLEFVAEAAFVTLQIGIKNKLPKYISSKHFNRKHGKKAYYGQNKTPK